MSAVLGDANFGMLTCTTSFQEDSYRSDALRVRVLQQKVSLQSDSEDSQMSGKAGGQRRRNSGRNAAAFNVFPIGWIAGPTGYKKETAKLAS